MDLLLTLLQLLGSSTITGLNNNLLVLKKVQDALHRATVDSNSEVGTIFQVLHTKESPPTYFRTNKFTTAFQEIVDAYG